MNQRLSPTFSTFFIRVNSVTGILRMKHKKWLFTILEWFTTFILLGGGKKNGEWLWDNEVPINMDQFALNQPDSSSTCFAMYGESGDYGWDDWGCGYSARYACERNF